MICTLRNFNFEISFDRFSGPTHLISLSRLFKAGKHRKKKLYGRCGPETRNHTDKTQWARFSPWALCLPIFFMHMVFVLTRLHKIQCKHLSCVMFIVLPMRIQWALCWQDRWSETLIRTCVIDVLLERNLGCLLKGLFRHNYLLKKKFLVDWIVIDIVFKPPDYQTTSKVFNIGWVKTSRSIFVEPQFYHIIFEKFCLFKVVLLSNFFLTISNIYYLRVFFTCGLV